MTAEQGYIIPRISNDEITFATIIVWYKNGTFVLDVNELFAQLRNAITRWMNETEEGKEAYLNSSGDFNIGDIVTEVSFQDMQTIASLIRGVEKFEVETFTQDFFPSDWVFDSHLFNEDDLKIKKKA